MQLPLLFGPEPSSEPLEEWLLLGNRRLRLLMVRNHLARRYILRLRRDGAARVTIPRRGSRLALDNQSHSMTQANTLYPPM